MKRNLFAGLLSLLLISLPLQARETVPGEWKTIDDETGRARSVVKLYLDENGKLAGDVVQGFPEPGEPTDRRCDKCAKDDPRYQQPIIGMTIVRDMKKTAPGHWEGGKILDPIKGKEYRCEIWLEDGKLKVRGYLMMFYRTQTWEPWESASAASD